MGLYSFKGVLLPSHQHGPKDIIIKADNASSKGTIKRVQKHTINVISFITPRHGPKGYILEIEPKLDGWGERRRKGNLLVHGKVF